MGWLHRLLDGSLHAMSYPPDHDFWYQPVGTVTMAGIRLDAEQAKKISAWYRGRDILATSLAMLPLGMNQRLPNDGGRDAAPTHPLHDVLHRKPNTWQDSFRWRRQAMYHIIDHGNAYSRIVEGRRGFVDQLRPISPPTRVTPEQIDDTGRMLYHVRDKQGLGVSTYTQDEVFHLCGASDDGIVGKGILDYARDNLGLGLTLESYASKLFSKGTLSGGVIEVPGVMDAEAGKRMAKSFVTAAGEWHLPKVLEQGAKWVKDSSSMDPEKAQMILSRKFSLNDIARWLGLPPHMLADLERSTNNNIEHQGQEFVTYNLGPWLTLWEFAINDQLVLRPQTYYAEFVRDALVRGDIAARWQAYMQAVTSGTFTRNEIRVMENKKKLPGLDEPLTPANITGRPGATARVTPPPKRPGDDDRDDDHAQAIATEAAARLLRKEIKAVQKLAVKHAADADAFAVAVTAFYAAHAALVQQTLQMASADANAYCSQQARQLLSGDWIAALESWQTDHYAAGLAALALEETAA